MHTIMWRKKASLAVCNNMHPFPFPLVLFNTLAPTAKTLVFLLWLLAYSRLRKQRSYAQFTAAIFGTANRTYMKYANLARR